MMSKMMIINIIKAGCFIVLVTVLSACKKDYLSFEYTDGSIREADLWSLDINARNFLNSSYFGLIGGYSIDGDGALLASGSDEAVNSNPSSSINILNNGTWGPLRTIDDQYNNMYNYIRRTNLFLEKSLTSAITPASDIQRLRGEAFFLRGMYHFELMKRYGAIIISNRSFTAEEDLDLPKNTVDEVVKQITSDCDSAANYITAISSLEWGTGDKGRATKAAALALKAQALLYAASPLYNPANDRTKWAGAAAAAKAVIDLNKHLLLTLAQLPNLWNFNTLPYNAEVIFASTAENTTTIERDNAPISYEGNGRTNPTQELVDAFEIRSTGRPITDLAAGYDPINPYSVTGASARDPRLGLFIMYNNILFKTRPVETFRGGKDNVPANVNSTRTGYYMRKFLSDSAVWESGKTATLQRRPWVYSRYADILLIYAEALNESLAAPDANVYGAINQVRTRAGIPNLPAGMTQSQMRDRIQNERRVELCFEGHRFYDVRRWKKGDQYFNKPVSGMLITKSGTSFSHMRFPVETRVFSDKNYFFPFPQSELNKTSKLVQNAGY